MVLVRESALRRLFPGFRVYDEDVWIEGTLTEVSAPDDAVSLPTVHVTVELSRLRSEEVRR